MRAFAWLALVHLLLAGCATRDVVVGESGIDDAPGDDNEAHTGDVASDDCMPKGGGLASDGTRSYDACGMTLVAKEGSNRLLFSGHFDPARLELVGAPSIRALVGEGDAMRLVPLPSLAPQDIDAAATGGLVVCDTGTGFSDAALTITTEAAAIDVSFTRLRPCPDLEVAEDLAPIYDGACAALDVVQEAAGPLLLVDSSRDGGVWWFPQEPGGENALEDHQGKRLADHFRDAGWGVLELPREVWIAPDLLSCFQAVLRPAAYDTADYDALETETYLDWVEGGGRLLLASDHMRYQRADPLADAFGIHFEGVTDELRPEIVFDGSHPLGVGVGTVEVPAASCVTKVPQETFVFARFAAGVTCTLGVEGDAEREQVDGGIAGGTIPYGEGAVWFFAETNFLEETTQPLTGPLESFAVGSWP
jgi:hypothetical protein